jgi:hypothetical protein
MSWEDLTARTLLYLEQRSASYKQSLGALLKRKKPVTGVAEPMLADLARFCRAHGTCFGATDRDTYVLIGRKQVFDRITEHLRLTPQQLLVAYHSFKPPTENE